MILVKTIISLSLIHDVGLYADQFIPKGTIIWEFTKGIDARLSKKKFEKWASIDPEQVFNYTYLDKNSGEYILCGDGARFMNHSKIPNSWHIYSKNKYGQTIAIRDIDIGEEITYRYEDCERNSISRGIKDFDNPKVIVKNSRKYGQAMFARDDIYEGEIITKFNGLIFQAKNVLNIPNDPPFYWRDHAVQFDENKWRDSRGIARFTAHSCNPNCGIKNKFYIAAMRNIKKDEEITFDYDMSENSDWKMECRCESRNCRRLIRGYRFLPESIKNKYKGYTSEYLINRLL